MKRNKKSRSASDLLGGDDDEHDDAYESMGDAEKAMAVSKELGDSWAKVRKGVTVAWLGNALRMDRKTVQKRLVGCPVKFRGRGAYPIYDLAEAMSYLVKPNFDISDYMRTMNPSELPPVLKKEFWQAENQRALYMERAGELWHTEDVLVVLAEAFKHIRDILQVFPDDLEREVDLKPKQYDYVTERVNALREDLFKTLIEMPKNRKTKSLLTSRDRERDDSNGDDTES